MKGNDYSLSLWPKCMYVIYNIQIILSGHEKQIDSYILPMQALPVRRSNFTVRALTI